jgi:hypothetical protein
MEAGACCGSFSRTSSRTEVSTAVTIANQAQVIIGIGPDGQLAATAPLLKHIRFNFFPRHECACLALHFEHGSRTKAKGLTHFLRNADFTVILNNGTHETKIDNSACKSTCEFSRPFPFCLHPGGERFCEISLPKKGFGLKSAHRWSEHWARREIFDHFIPPRFAKRRGRVRPRQLFF